MDLDIARVLKSVPKDYGPEELAPLMTPWGEKLQDRPVAYTSHPRPLFARDTWHTLDGWWDCVFVSCEDAASAWRDATPPKRFDQSIRVPFSPEASLSGVMRQLQPDELLWYRRRFPSPDVPEGGSCLLHFDGVDYACALYVNGSKMAEHQGAYLPFVVDVTDVLQEDENELLLCVFDPSETGTQLRGKQRLARGGMWYTAQSGIWQSVWLETLPSTHVEELSVTTDDQTGELGVSVRSNAVAMLSVEVYDGETMVAQGMQSRRVEGRMSLTLSVPAHKLWSPQTPQVYDLRVMYGEDTIHSYVAFRSVGVEADEQGMPRLCLNHQPIFVRGLLDQGYWPDGLLTPPTQDAMAFDISAAQSAGFNLLRKHIKVESERFYALCDRMGMLVMQDMPSGGAVPSDHWSRDRPTLVRSSWHRVRDDTRRGHARLGSTDPSYQDEWLRTTKDVIERLAPHPCIMAWVLFNESWGQFDSAAATQMAWDLDDTRPVLSASGWFDQGSGDIRGVHNYFRGTHMFADPYVRRKGMPTRAQMVSEFGGLTWRVEGHAQLEHTYGYAEFDTLEAWRTALVDLLAATDALEAEGLSGFVYTELTDVEEETNGLLTYDRRVNKLDL